MSAEMTSRSMPSRGTKYSFWRVVVEGADEPWLRGCFDIAKSSAVVQPKERIEVHRERNSVAEE